ncbi:MAG: 30S ribosomal protein S5 [Patescibacteria group bacterium]
MAKEMRENNKRAPRKDGFREVEKEFKEELLEVARVTRVTAGGRQLRFRAAVVVGNGKGTVGLGTGKAAEVVVAIEKAVRDAKKNLITFPIVSGSVPHEVKANFKATSVLLHPASEGTGVIAGGAIRKLLFVSGLKDVLAKRFGGRNQMTNVRAAIKALAALKPLGATPTFAKAAPAVEAVAAPAATEAAPAKKAPAKKPAAKKAAAE